MKVPTNPIGTPFSAGSSAKVLPKYLVECRSKYQCAQLYKSRCAMSDDIEIHMYIKGTLPNQNPTIGFLRSLTKRERDVAKISNINSRKDFFFWVGAGVWVVCLRTNTPQKRSAGFSRSALSNSLLLLAIGR